MMDGLWQDGTSAKKDIRNAGNETWITILNDFLGPAAEDEDGNTDTTQQELGADGVSTEIVKPENEDPISRSGIYLAENGTITDPKIYAKIQQGIKNIVRSLVKRAKMVKSEKGENTDSWAKTDGYAGMRGSGRSNSSWEFSLVHAKGIEWPKDPVTGEPALDKDGNPVGPIEKAISEGTLLKATQAKEFFEKLAAGQFKVNRNCARLSKMVSIDEGDSKTRISYHKDGEGVVKNAGAPELDAIRRIKERCECKGKDDEGKNTPPGCIDPDKSPFGSLGKFKYTSQVINDYVGKMVESLRVSGLLLRMYSQAKTPKEKSKLFGFAQEVIAKARSNDDILHQAALARLGLFEQAGADMESFADIEVIAQLENLTNGQRKNLYKIIIKLEAEDLAARDPDIVLPIGLTVGDGDRKDNMEAHLTRKDLVDSLINQGVDPKKVDKYINETTLDDLEGVGADPVYTAMYKDVHGIDGNTPIYGMGLSLKNQLHDGSTKFGEQTRAAQSDLIMLPDKDLSESQLAFREKAYEETGITTDADRKAIRKKQKEHDDIKTAVYGLFPGTEWFMSDEDGKSVRETPKPIAERIIKQIKSVLPYGNEIREELEDLLTDEDPETEDGVGRIREKLTRILTTHKTHKECSEVETKGKNKGQPTADALLARKYLATTFFFTGGSVDEILASKRGFTSGEVAIYSQNDVVRPIIKGIVDGTWEVAPSSRGGLTTHIKEPTTGRHVSFSRQGEGGSLGRHTRFELEISKGFLEKHLLKRKKNKFIEDSYDILLSLMGTQQQLFEKLLMQVQ